MVATVPCKFSFSINARRRDVWLASGRHTRHSGCLLHVGARRLSKRNCCQHAPAWRVKSKENSSDSQLEAQESPQAWPYLKPLLLAFFASQRRSMFASSSLVRTAIEMYLQAQPWAVFELEVKLAGMQEGRQIGQLPEAEQAQARLMVDLEKDVLLQWIGLIYLTLEEMGVQKDSCGSLIGDNSQTVLGMRGFVKQTLGLGFDSQRLHLQQRLVNEEGKAVPASIRLMQENARLIVLTKEVALSQSQGRDQPEAKGSDSEDQRCGNLAIEQGESALVGQGLRQTAARILLAFLGAANGSQYSVNAFLEELLECYKKGWAAHEVFGALKPEEFESGQTLFPVAAQEGSGRTNSDMLATWISAVYITLVQVGLPSGGAKKGEGWAWAAPVGQDDAVAANRLSQCVAGTLQNQAKAEGRPPPEDSPAMAAVKELPQASRLPRPGQGYAFVEDPSVRETSSAVAVMSQLVTLVQLTRTVALTTLGPAQKGAT